MQFPSLARRDVLAMLAVALLGVSCGRGGATSTRDLTTPQQYGGSYVGGTATGDTEKGAAFARWVLEQDPQRQYITDAIVRGEQDLGVKVQPTVTKGDLQQLLTALAQGMARTFPGKSLRVIAFYQSGDRLAEAAYDPRTTRIDVRFER